MCDRRHEVSVLQNVPVHDNILGLLGVCLMFKKPGEEKISVAVIVPFKQGGSLHSYIGQKSASPVFLPTRLSHFACGSKSCVKRA